MILTRFGAGGTEEGVNMEQGRTQIPVEPVPETVLQSLAENGFALQGVLAAVCSDLSKDGQFADCWLLLTQDQFLVAEGVTTWERAGEEASWKLCSCECYNRNDWKEFHLEMLPTTGLLTGEGESGSQLLSRFSLARNRQMGAFVKLANKLLCGEDWSDKDANLSGKEDCCPKCGRRYRNREERICPYCINRKKVFFRLLSHAKQYRGKIVLLIVCLFFAAGLDLLVPYLAGTVFVDQVLSADGKYFGKVAQVVGILAVIRLLMMLFESLSGRINAVLANRIVYGLRTDVFRAMQNLSIRFFTDKQTGTLMTRVNQDAEEVQWFFIDGIPFFFTNCLNLIGVSSLMIAMQPGLSLLVLLPLPLLFVFFSKFLPKYDKMFWKSHRARSSMNVRMNDSFEGVRVVKAFGKEESENAAFRKASHRFSDARLRIGLTSNTVFPIVHFIIWLGSLMVYLFGGIMVIQGTVLFGEITALVGYIGMIYNPLQWFAGLVQDMANAMNSANRIFEIVDAQPEVREQENPICLHPIQGNVRLEHVFFGYEPNRSVLKDISIDVRAGENIGIVGPSGAGKSTLINLITRLYDVEDGSITIDGVNVKELSLSCLREQVGIVLQDTFLFMGTVAENIAYARPDAEREEIIRAAKAANAHDFIMALPDGYDTRIGTGGQGLSGGERQRISLARAVLKNPRILILDEATSAIDTKTESQIQSSLEQLAKGRTTFNIAHRLSTLRNADRLIVLEDGKLAESGTHQELYEKKGVYYRLYQIQKEALKVKGIQEEE